MQAALAAIKPGEPCAAPHLACQAVIDRAGYTENFKKRAGYSIGISFAPDWGEGGILSLYTGVKTELQPGMTLLDIGPCSDGTQMMSAKLLSFSELVNAHPQKNPGTMALAASLGR